MLKISSKGTVSIFLLLAAICLLLSSCENPLIQKILDFKTVSFNTNGGSSVPDQNLIKGWKITRPDDPVKPDSVFDGWYKDNDAFLYEWDFDDVPAADIILHAKWIVEGGNQNETIITTVSITVTGPAKGEPPDTTADGDGNFTIGTVTWSPNDNPFNGGTVYTVSVTIMADDGYTFASELTSAAINGLTAIVTNNTGRALTLSHTFAQTDTRTVTGITIASQLSKLEYIHGDALDLTGLVVTLAFDTDETEDVALDSFALRNISTVPADGADLRRSTNNSRPVTVHYGHETASTYSLIVNHKALTITGAAHTKQYDGTTTASGVTVTLGGILGNDDVSAGTVTAEYTSAAVGTQTINITDVTLTGSQADNYTVHLPVNIAVTGITKAEGAAVTQFAVTGNNPSTLSVTVSAALAVSTGQSVEYAFSTSNSAPTADADWRDTGAFTLPVDTLCYIFARSASNDNYNAGAPASTQAAFYTVSFDKNGGDTDPVSQVVFINDTIPAAPSEPSRAGYNFTGWYKEQACENEWGFETDRVTGTLTLYAGWEANTTGIILSIEEIVNGTPSPSVNNVILSKTGSGGYSSTQSISIGNPGAYSSIQWRVAGVGVSNDVTGSGNSFTLNANADEYGTIGGHTLMLTVTIGGNQYMVNIRFTIRE
jgi:uncharacterized repeat protein (TIGR02543 family)